MVKSIENELSAELERLKVKYRTTFSLFMKNVVIIAAVSVLTFAAYTFLFNNFNVGTSFKEKLYIILFGGFVIFEILVGIYAFYLLGRVCIYMVLFRRAVNAYTKKTIENLEKK